MRILHSWLEDYGKVPIPPEELGERLGMLGLETEHVERLGERYRGFVVGKVLEVARHPRADRLSVARVDVGGETLQIVCGAPNVAAGQLVPVGTVGAVVPRNQHDPDGAPMTLTRAAIRGVESFGMICSEAELDLGKDADGIMVLQGAPKPGTPLAEALGLDDVAYDLEITPNRPDWMSHVGVAREIAVLTGRHPRLPRVRLRESRTPAARVLRVAVQDRKNCNRFAARVVRGVRMGPSPEWMQNRLRNAGLRPRNAVVDVTNYVMLECGHPLHAFDLALLRGGRIVVRAARGGTVFTTLDGKERVLPAGAVMVCDGEREVSIAGVMGGANSEISDATNDVVLESAHWNPGSIRRTARVLGLSTDASQRFERGADPGMVRWALDRAAALVVEFCGGELLKGAVDVVAARPRHASVAVRPSNVNGLLGTTLTPAQMRRMLGLLGVRTSGGGKDRLVCRIPSHRVDLQREVDLIEEVARVYGYDRIGETAGAHVTFAHPYESPSELPRVREAMVGLGCREAVTNSMVEPARAALPGVEPVTVLNPQNRELSTLRTSLVPGLLEVAARNINHGSPDLRIFEIGRVFRRDPPERPNPIPGYREEERLSALLTGFTSPRQWGVERRRFDVFDLKGLLEGLAARIGLDKTSAFSYSPMKGLTGGTLAVEFHGASIGQLGSVSDETLKSFGIDQPVFVFEVDLPALAVRKETAYRQLPRYPAVSRDVAFVLDASTPATAVERAIRKWGGELLRSADLFDLYEGDRLPPGKKSLAFTLTLRADDRTLTEAEIEAEVGRVVRGVEGETGGVLRAG